ncbi:F-box protein [Camellia lanceoleosa]|uniref:F-box protein n=1 Tax=Camellia lanceoleosa TaxID=1840588 RepID=A0ACC0HFW6_9ERIC|nr:F-box protein [Camellia lanceoleosa]
MMKQSIISKKKKNKQSIPEQVPIQIILEILSRLPIKSLFRCQLVCKEWFSSISDPHFAKLHLSRSPISLLIKPIFRESRKLRLFDLQILYKTHPREAHLKLTTEINIPYAGQEIVNSCNGLLCLCYKSVICVCNPILGETNQYKVIRFFIERVVESINPITELKTYRDDPKAMIYTIGDGLWRNLGSVPYYLKNRSFNSFVNGALHWLNFTCDSPDFIRCFDFDSEEFWVVLEPPEFGLRKEFSDHIRVGVLRGSLSIYDFSSPLRMDIWLMKDYGIKESWSKELVIENGIGRRGNLDCYEPIMILKSGEILMLVNKDALKMYNPRLGKFKKLNTYGIKSEFNATAHVPSFVSLRDVTKREKFSFVC